VTVIELNYISFPWIPYNFIIPFPKINKKYFRTSIPALYLEEIPLFIIRRNSL